MANRRPKAYLGVRIPPDWKKKLDDEATERGVSTSAHVTSILRSYLLTVMQRSEVPPPLRDYRSMAAPRKAEPVWPISKPHVAVAR